MLPVSHAVLTVSGGSRARVAALTMRCTIAFWCSEDAALSHYVENALGLLSQLCFIFWLNFGQLCKQMLTSLNESYARIDSTS